MDVISGFNVHAPHLIDRRAGPYQSVSDALAAIPMNGRREGLTVVITGNPQQEYWWKDGISDAHLQLKTGGSSTPEYYPIPVFAYLDGKVIQTKRDIGGGKFIESRVAYHASGDNVGKTNFIEIKDERTDPAIWVRETINYTNKVLTSTTVADIVAWTITI